MRAAAISFDFSKYLLPVSSTEIFGNSNNTILEIGFGEGEFIAEMAENHPSTNFIGVEVKYYRYKKATRLVERTGMGNVRLIHAEAHLAIQEIFRDGIFDKVYINFPDPWPKEKHLKHRLINPLFLSELYRIMKHGAVFEFVSDSEDYIRHTKMHLNSFSGFEDITAGNKVDIRRPSTRFQEEFMLENRDIYHICYIRN